MKPCTKCEVVKPLDAFNRDATHSDGHSSVCGDCRRANKRARWATRKQRLSPEEVAADNAARNKARRRYRKANPGKEAARRVGYAKNHPELAKKAQERHRLKHPAKVKARKDAANAIAAGKIKRLPCEVCGNEKTDAHHDDYNQPLVVRFLCRKHHAQWHRMVPPPQNDGGAMAQAG